MVLDRYATGLHLLSLHCCDRIPEQTYFEAWVSILCGAKGSKWTSTGAVVSFFFHFVKCLLFLISPFPFVVVFLFRSLVEWFCCPAEPLDESSIEVAES